MNLLEYEAKHLFRQYGISTPKGLSFKDMEGISSALTNLDFPLMVKAQTTVGGRGKAGGIRTALYKQEALEAAERILSMRIGGMKVHGVLLEEMVEASREIYLAITIDQRTRCPLLLAGNAGGMDVENMPAHTIRRWSLDPLEALPPEVLEQASRFLLRGETGTQEVRSTIQAMWRLFRGMDCELVEINPLMITDSGKAIAADAKVAIDDEALFRHPKFMERAGRDLTELERLAKERGFTLVEMAGDIGVLANGAGLTMAALDTLQRYGGRGGTFLDLGGTDDPDRISEALGLLSYDLAKGRTRSILVCIFGGITRCDTVADALMHTITDRNVKARTVVRLRGTNEEEAVRMLQLANFNVQIDLDEACLQAIKVRA
ncbi:MAG TPA: acetate--CoA ligase family protein [Methanomassiliicoccales archaeon]|jgi:succinyl-CoA synthetase beta subunit|nr:acetate--CoA ligase family protein [Methanomassiliicoccales archaeon]HRU11094.1 acetate--CoA ligase family protein [Methanomassiliicoccales archaeon]